MTSRIAAETEASIVELWTQGRHSTGDLAQQFGISRTTVQRTLHRNGTPFGVEEVRRYRRRTTPEQDAVIVARYLAGESGESLAREFGFKMHVSITQRVRAAGHPVRKPGGFERDYPADVQAEILRLRDAGWSQEKIASELHTSQSRVSSFLRSRGLRAWPMSRHPNYTGGPVKLSNGYMGVRVDDKDAFASMRTRSGYVLEHRYVMAQALGRPLMRGETVHHINGNIKDNRLENLQLRQGPHGRGVVFACLDCGSHRVTATPLPP